MDIAGHARITADRHTGGWVVWTVVGGVLALPAGRTGPPDPAGAAGPRLRVAPPPGDGSPGTVPAAAGPGWRLNGRWVAALRRARAAGVEVGVLTGPEGAGGSWPAEVPVPCLFDHRVRLDGADAGIEGARLELAARRAGAAPPWCVLVDADEVRARRAREAGWRVVRFDHTGQAVADLEVLLGVRLRRDRAVGPVPGGTHPGVRVNGLGSAARPSAGERTIRPERRAGAGGAPVARLAAAPRIASAG